MVVAGVEAAARVAGSARSPLPPFHRLNGAPLECQGGRRRRFPGSGADRHTFEIKKVRSHGPSGAMRPRMARSAVLHGGDAANQLRDGPGRTTTKTARSSPEVPRRRPTACRAARAPGTARPQDHPHAEREDVAVADGRFPSRMLMVVSPGEAAGRVATHCARAPLRPSLGKKASPLERRPGCPRAFSDLCRVSAAGFRPLNPRSAHAPTRNLFFTSARCLSRGSEQV